MPRGLSFIQHTTTRQSSCCTYLHKSYSHSSSQRLYSKCIQYERSRKEKWDLKPTPVSCQKSYYSTCFQNLHGFSNVMTNKTNTNYNGTVPHIQTRSFKTLQIPLDNTQVTPSPLKGRDLLDFSNWSRDDIFTILWIAVELKQRSKDESLELCKDKTAILFYEDIFTKTGILKGISNAKGITSSIHVSHLPTKDKMNLRYFSRALSAEADAIFIQNSQLTLDDLKEISGECYKPVINVRNYEIAPVYALAEILTMFEHYGFLRRLIVAYLGPVENPTLRTYVTLFPKIGIHFRYASEKQISDDLWSEGINISTKSKFPTDFQHMSTGQDAIWRAHVITTFFDGEDNTGANLGSRDMEEAELDWTFYHHDIHQGTNCVDELLKCKQSMIWNTLDNLQWISKALLVGLTTSYSPRIKRPGFQGLAG